MHRPHDQEKPRETHENVSGIELKMFFAVLSMMKGWKQPKYTLIEELNKLINYTV